MELPFRFLRSSGRTRATLPTSARRPPDQISKQMPGEPAGNLTTGCLVLAAGGGEIAKE